MKSGKRQRTITIVIKPGFEARRSARKGNAAVAAGRGMEKVREKGKIFNF
jgi:hypothetical protein